MKILLTLYIIGCILSLMRTFAGAKSSNRLFIKYGWNTKYNMFRDWKNFLITTIMILSSWLGFLLGILMYFVVRPKEVYFLSFSPSYKENDIKQ